MPPPPPKTIQAAVFIDSNGDAVIFPPVIIAAKGDDVDIVNATADDIVIIYPNDVFKDSGGQLKRSADVAEKAQKKKKTVDAAAVSGRHPFKVFSFATGVFAKANSDPEFIIE